MKPKLLLLMLLISSMCFAQAPTDYYAYYPFTNGSIVNEANPGVGDLTSGNYTFVSDRFGNPNSAMDCENTRVNGFHNSTNVISEFAVSFWVKMDVLPATATTGTQRVIDFYENAASGDYLFFNRTSPGDFEIVYQVNGWNVSRVFQSTALESGQWCHVVLQSVRTVNGPTLIDNHLQFYFNGNLETVISSNLNLPHSGVAYESGAAFSISRDSNFPGLVDDIQLFSRALNSQEVSDIYSVANCTSTVNIPDANFKNALLAHGTTITGTGISVIDTDGDGEISCSEAQVYSGAINVGTKSISNLSGIEAFTNITSLNCGNNQLSSIDVSSNTKLREFRSHLNPLTTIDVSLNTALEILQINNCQLTSLDLSANTNLEELYCQTNQLTSLNVANGNNANMRLIEARLNSNLSCIQHDTGFDPTTNSSWTKDASARWSANCSAPACTSVVNIPDTNFKNALLGHGTTISGTGISVIDTDGDGIICTTEAQAYAGTISVSSQNISDLTGIEAFVNIQQLKCHSNNLTSIDISANTGLSWFSADNNQLTSVNLANGNNSTTLSVVNVSNNTNLTCIQHDAGFDPTTNNNWTKDTSANWSTNCNLSVGDEVFNSGVRIYPNPATTILTISSEIATIKSVEIYNVLGSKIVEVHTQNVDVSRLPNGIYIAKIKSNDNRLAIKKFIKQ